MPQTIIFVIILLFIIMFFISAGIKIVPAKSVFIIERYGAYNRTLQPGLYFIMPFVDRVVNVVDLSQREYRTNEGIFRTFDDISLSLKIKISYIVIDPKLYHYAFSKDLYNIQEIAFDNIRSLILKNTMKDIKLDLRDVEEKLTVIITETVRTWGLNILEVHIVL